MNIPPLTLHQVYRILKIPLWRIIIVIFYGHSNAHIHIAYPLHTHLSGSIVRLCSRRQQRNQQTTIQTAEKYQKYVNFFQFFSNRFMHRMFLPFCTATLLTLESHKIVLPHIVVYCFIPYIIHKSFVFLDLGSSVANNALPMIGQ